MVRSAPRRSKIAELEAALARKDILLRELAHRAKNNFTILASIASLESQRVGSGEAAALARIHGSITAMALLFDRLALQDGRGEVDAARYLEEVYRLIAGAIAPIALELDLEPVLLDPRRATALGLIANETTANAVKHAFAGREAGLISVRLRQEGAVARFTVEDDGPGFPADFDPERDGDFGLDFLAIEAQELGGGLRLGAGRGAKVEIEFPV